MSLCFSSVLSLLAWSHSVKFLPPQSKSCFQKTIQNLLILTLMTGSEASIMVIQDLGKELETVA